MFTNFAEFFTCVKEARFTFAVIRDAIIRLYYAITENSNISAIWNGITDAVTPFYKTVMTVLVVACVAVALFGRKMMGFLKFVAFFVVGFALGTHLLAPVLPPEVSIPAWIVGIVVALVAAVLYKFIYVVLYVGVAGYGMYILAYHGFYLSGEVGAYTTGKALACVIAALVAVILALVFKKYIEMIGTAFLGGWCASWIFANQIYNYTAWFGERTWLAILIPTLVIALIGSLVQIKTRKRY